MREVVEEYINTRKQDNYELTDGSYVSEGDDFDQKSHYLDQSESNIDPFDIISATDDLYETEFEVQKEKSYHQHMKDFGKRESGHFTDKGFVP